MSKPDQMLAEDAPDPGDPAAILPDTRSELRACAEMLRLWLPHSFPANERGQIHFVRAMLESCIPVMERAADEIGAVAE